MTWFVVYSTTTGSLFSQGSTAPQNLPTGLTSASLAEQPTDGQMWDSASLSFIPRPAQVLRDRLLDILTDSAYADDLQTIWSGLSANQRNLLRTGLSRLLNKARFRPDGEPLAIGEKYG